MPPLPFRRVPVHACNPGIGKQGCNLIFQPLGSLPEKPDLATVHRIKAEAYENGQVMDHLFYLTDVNGPRLAINWIQENVPGILCAWYDGEAQGTAITDVLFGDYNPGGKLTTTWYKDLDGIPPVTQYALRDGNRTYWYFNGAPLYPFGHGLSYTEFQYSPRPGPRSAPPR